ncbi:hypothetical protein [Sphingobacterium multivorum]|uniref:hypothetical protein n=1 Tax=Sphingobacterium multivorum TaxID=28454 RepID=UPI0036B18BA9
MDKLTLEVLAPYLPYGVQIIDNNKLETIIGIVNNKVFIEDCHRNGYAQIEDVKPILRPLSDLSSYNERFEESWISRLNKECIEVSNAGGIWLDSDLDFDLMYDRCEPPVYLRIEYTSKCRDWLVKNHFDVFGLIEKGLSVDINQIDNLNLSNN